MDDEICTLCGHEEDNPDHLWTCHALKEEREEADKELAEIDPRALPMSVKCGIAPAMRASTNASFWGKHGQQHMSQKKKLCGDRGLKKAHCNIAKAVHQLNEEGQECTAREVMQSMLEQRKGSEALPAPKKTTGKPPARPNVYSDGSVHNP